MFVNKSSPYRQPHDLQIEPNGPMLNVMQIVFDPFSIDVFPSIHLLAPTQ